MVQNYGKNCYHPRIIQKFHVPLHFNFLGMKKLVLILFCCLTVSMGYSQRFIGSIIAGANASQVEGDDVRGYKKAGFVGGASVMIALDKKMQWFATVELLYTQKGSRSSTTRAFDTTNYAPAMFLDVDRSADFMPSSKYKCRLDLDYVEDSNAGTDTNFVMNDKGELLEIQGTAEGAPFTAEQLMTMMKMAENVMPLIFSKQKEALGKKK